MNKILIIEDDPSLGKNLNKLLLEEGYITSLATSLKMAKDILDEHYSLIILDWMLPDGQGIDFLKEVRSNNDFRPIIMLTARVDLIDKILGLESGANDYLTKPFEPRELLARIRVQLRSANDKNISEKNKAVELFIGELKIREESREVYYKEKLVEMTKMEYEFLRLLMSNPGKVFSREEILNKVWGYENYPSTRTVDTHMLQLRHKISSDYFETIRGIGYRLKTDVNQEK